MEYNKILFGEIRFVPHSVLNNNNNSNNHNNNNSSSKHNTESNQNHVHQTPTSECLASFKAPKHQLSDPNLVRLEWSQSDKIGGGLINVGNTCFLNSVLQCLTYCPPLYNYLVKQNGGHASSCKLNQFCMLCEMEKHIKRIKSSNGTPIKPISIVHRLKYINKSFQFGRQEDAHEFLRYLIDHMWKACLMNLDINVKSNTTGDRIDSRIKETTAINHIFGGYHRSQVLCLSCNSRSNTFDFFMDFILDIRHAKSLEESLKKFTQPETLEHENAYKCSRCKKKVTAKKRFSVYKAPNVATFQLKRFDSDRIYGGKITKYVSYPEELDLRPYMSESSKMPIGYSLSAVLVHVGHSSNSGHYFCFIKNSNGFWYRMDDSHVTIVNKSIVLQQQAYILFYTKKSSELKQQSYLNGVEKVKSTISISSNGISESNNVPKKILVNGSNNNDNNQNNNHNNSYNNNNIRIVKPTNTSITTWLGSKSKLEDESSKTNEVTERDRFNDELDQGKVKKIKLNNFSKPNRPSDPTHAQLQYENHFQWSYTNKQESNQRPRFERDNSSQKSDWMRRGHTGKKKKRRTHRQTGNDVPAYVRASM